jgi:signal transduction histidine kinase/ActR/RegA family two-component response regulator
MLFGFIPVALSQPGTETPHRDAPKLTRLIQAERVRMLYASAPYMAVISAIAAVALAFAVNKQTDRSWAINWAIVCVLASVARWVDWMGYQRSKQRDAPTWLRHLTLLCVLHGGSWGLLGLMMPVNDMVTSSVMAATLVGACAMCTFILQAHFLPNFATNVLMLLPASLVFLTRWDAYGLFMGLGLLTLLSMLLFESRRAELRITELLRLRFITDHIASERAAALVTMQQHNVVKDRFLATMSHEMRTPLHGILGLARLTLEHLHKQPDNPAVTVARHKIELIERAGKHLLHIINDVLDFSRIEAGKLHVERAPFDLRALVDDVMGLLYVNAAEKGLDLQAEMSMSRPYWVMGDASRVRQILHNLLGNAIKFTETGKVLLNLARSPENSAMRFQITDTGVGIPPDELPRIFDAFHQVNAAYSRQQLGTGLGLTITREIARAMGGDVVCESQLGKGSVFTITLPLPEAVAPDEPMFNELQQGCSPRFQAHVLLVEDNAVNAMVAEATLQRFGLQVTRAEDGAEALALLCHTPSPFQLVLMDLQMPNMDGVTACRNLRMWERDHRVTPVPVIALTANGLSSDRAQCLAAGMNDHLPKPFRVDELLTLLQRHLADKVSDAAAVTA